MNRQVQDTKYKVARIDKERKLVVIAYIDLGRTVGWKAQK